jgi:Winged helix DNA-binding domain
VRLEPLAVVRDRLRRQRLVGRGFATVVEAVRFLGAVQGQEYAEAKWSVGERVAGATEADVDAALDSGAVLRTHVMRPTWHFVAAEDIRWLLELTAPRVHRAVGSYYRTRGLDAAEFARGHEAIEAALRPGEPLIRARLYEALERAGLGSDRLRLAHVLMHAELEGLICSGPRQGKQHTYALLSERVPGAPRLEHDEALAELTRRYFTSHGPATLNDFSWWSGLTVAQARRGLELVGGELARAEAADGTAWYAAPGPAGRARVDGALLVPTYDESTIAYKDLRVVLAAEPPRRGPFERPIVIGGLTVGSWKRMHSTGGVTVETRLFTPLDPEERERLEAAADRFGRFFGLPATVAPGR